MGVLNVDPSLQRMFDALGDRIQALESSKRFTAPYGGTNPAYPSNGDLWVRSDTSTVYAQIAGTATAIYPASGGATVVAGSIIAYGGASAPTGYLLCDGSNQSRTTYSALFAVIGTTYGAGDGSTTFGIPDLRGRVIAGKDNMGGLAANRITAAGSGITGTTLGASGGLETVTLATTDIPAHSHANTLTNNAVTSGNQSADHSHTFSTGGYSADHSHNYGYSFFAYAGGGSLTAAVNNGLVNATTNGQSVNHSHSGTTAGMSVSHSHSVTSNVTISNVNAGGGLAHQNTQPTIILNYIMKT